MSIIYTLIPIAMIFVAVAVAIFFWAVKSNQFDDLERHGSSILFDDQHNTTAGKSHAIKPNANKSTQD